MLITYFYLIKCEVSKFLCMSSLYLFLFNCPGDSLTPFFRDTVLYFCLGLSYLRYFSTNNLVFMISVSRILLSDHSLSSVSTWVVSPSFQLLIINLVFFFFWEEKRMSVLPFFLPPN